MELEVFVPMLSRKYEKMKLHCFHAFLEKSLALQVFMFSAQWDAYKYPILLSRSTNHSMNAL